MIVVIGAGRERFLKSNGDVVSSSGIIVPYSKMALMVTLLRSDHNNNKVRYVFSFPYSTSWNVLEVHN